MTFASTLLLSAVVMGCIGPGRRSQPSRDSLGRVQPGSSSAAVSTRLQALVRGDDPQATIAYTSSVLSRDSAAQTDDRTRGLCEHARARAQSSLGLHHSALSSFQRAWHLVGPDDSSLGASVLEDWADEQMRNGQPTGAKQNYTKLLGWDSVSSSRRRRLTAALVVACEESGATAEAMARRAELGRAALNLLADTRARLAPRSAPVLAPRLLPRLAARGSIPADSRVIIPGLTTRSSWGAAPIAPNHGPMTTIRAITVHHSAFAAPAAGSAAAQIRAIQADHQADRGWADIGYHFLIDAQGKVWEGRRLIYQGAHAGSNAPDLNVGNIGICLLGNFETGPVPAAQEAALIDLLDTLTAWFGLSRDAVHPHSDFKPSTLCPGSWLKPIVSRYRGAGRLSFERQ